MSEAVPDLFAEVSVFSALDKTLHYRVPAGLSERASAGMRVLVPLSGRSAVGVIVAVSGNAPDLVDSGIEFKPILALLDSRPIFSRDLIDLFRWISGYYFYPLGEVFQTALPAGAANPPKVFFRLTSSGKEKAGDAESGLLQCFAGREKVSPAEVAGQSSTPANVKRRLRDLEAKGLIERFYEWRSALPGPRIKKIVRLLSDPDPELCGQNENLKALTGLLGKAEPGLALSFIRQQVKNADYWVRKLCKQGFAAVVEEVDVREFQCAQTLPFEPPPELTPDQQAVFDAVLPAIVRPAFEPFMLFGVTGSGKTEIYLRLVAETLKQGRGALVLVPEIGLSTQLEALFRRRFASCLALWHSAIPVGARHDQWQEIVKGAKTIVLGARSAVFMPVRDLGLIVVDEEHDSSYKQDDHLRYHARDVALMRARLLGIPIVLGSATPSLQTVHLAKLGRCRPLSLPARILDRPLPELEIVDMRRESSQSRVLSYRLRNALTETLAAGDQALLFLNRRGFAACYVCSVCGAVLQCGSCSVSMTYHKREKMLRCHYCGKEEAVPERCPACDHTSLFPLGFGTERVEAEVRHLLPDARIVRIDRDSVDHPKALVESLNAIRRRDADVLIGTQMVGKGHDFPDITLVGVVNADMSLQFPDFRAGETTVQLLMQVAGRAGRGEKPGRVVLQTYNQFHYTIECVSALDYRRFCDIELESREKLQYPPFTRFMKFLVTSGDEGTTERAARRLAAICRDEAESIRDAGRHVAVLGPSAAPLVKLKNRFRWHVFAKAWASRDLQDFTEAVISRAKADPAMKRAQIAVDRDPMMSM